MLQQLKQWTEFLQKNNIQHEMLTIFMSRNDFAIVRDLSLLKLDNT